MKKRYAIGACLGLIIITLAFTGILGYLLIKNLPKTIDKPTWPDFKPPQTELTADQLIQFTSEQDFKEYLASSQSLSGGLGFGNFGRGSAPLAAESADGAMMDKYESSIAPLPDRVSQTNVQVVGIDEPDIVKTNGQQIFFAREPRYYYDDIYPLKTMEEISPSTTDSISSSEISPTSDVASIAPPPSYEPNNLTEIINALPIDKLSSIGKIDQTGNLLIVGQTLIVIGNDNRIIGYNISNPSQPIEKWIFKLKDSTYLTASRLYKNDLYLITQTYINSYKPCPFELADLGNKTISIGCGDIFHPTQPSLAETTHSIIKLDAVAGTQSQSISFIGSYDNSVIYMSGPNIYLTYSQPRNFVKLFSDFIQENIDLYPFEIRTKINRLESYEISENAKMVELQSILDTYQASLDEDERLKLQNEQENKITNYLQKHGREMEKTGIVRLSSDNLEIKANGAIPGRLLNQFSLDEYQDHLRVATSIEGSNWYFGFGGGSNNSVNDLYVLDSNLKQTGSVLDLGKGERIYSARFINGQGYIVTFKETDPFYVFDLSNPDSPKLSGELKIPGYSSYLHPIADNIILGVGKEDANVKLSLFDISNPANPKEVDKYILNEYWSEAIYNHHAFLQDAKNQVFFLPGGQGGYIFGYLGNKLKLIKAVSDFQVKRALYINNYFYILSENKIVVYDESNWEKVGELDLK